MRKTTLLLTAVLAGSLALPAFAQPPGGGRAPPSPEERAAAFDKADANKDGKLSKDEFKTTLPEQFQANADMVFERRDADKDGFISKDEYMAGGGRGGGGGRRGGGAPGGQ